MKKKQLKIIISLIILIGALIYTYFNDDINNLIDQNNDSFKSYALSEIPKYDGKPYVIINNNEPTFEDSDFTSFSYEKYGQLDNLGRVTTAIANIGLDLMPKEKRGSIGMIKPTGWHTVKYDIIDGLYLYNRCHLIAYQLTGENANPQNLMTCTRFTNATTMVEFENKVANYIKKTNNHVLYKVTPVFEDDNLLASGILMEGYSIEDKGEGIKFNVYVYNVQEGIIIDYKTGESRLSGEN